MDKITTYPEATAFLFERLAVFQRQGGSAYKPGLDTAIALDNACSNPHRHYASIHIAGTNGKGSTAHTLAAILQSAGYRTGLFTSPHLVDFRERIRVNGEMIPREAVVEFVNRFIDMKLAVWPSFFELTSAMALDWFAKQRVDFAVIETGLGGRLDSTNIITPALSVITNISSDHTQFLGTTLPEIAYEKAGIIKPCTPVVVGEAPDAAVRRVFEAKAKAEKAPIVFAQDHPEIISASASPEPTYTTRSFGTIHPQLTGEWQRLNADTILAAVKELKDQNIEIDDEAVRAGFAHVCELTGLQGRWMKLDDAPLTICDTGHNTGGWTHLAARLNSIPGTKHMVIGFVNDKDINGILSIMATIKPAVWHFTNASIPRALPAAELSDTAMIHGLKGSVDATVADAYRRARSEAAAEPQAMVFVGGSTFVVADLLAALGK